MARFVSTGKALATTANTNLISIRSAAQQRAKILEISCWAEAATAWVNPALFLTTVVDTAGTGVTGQKEDSGSGTASVTVVTGPTGGTLAAVAHRRASLPAVIGAGFSWQWPEDEPLRVPLSLSALIRNDGVVGPAISWQVVWDE